MEVLFCIDDLSVPKVRPPTPTSRWDGWLDVARFQATIKGFPNKVRVLHNNGVGLFKCSLELA